MDGGCIDLPDDEDETVAASPAPSASGGEDTTGTVSDPDAAQLRQLNISK
jgi:hypothetical protein